MHVSSSGRVHLLHRRAATQGAVCKRASELACIDVQMARGTMARPQARFFGPVRARHGPVDGPGVGCHLGMAGRPTRHEK
jgi:hypothetical protein